MTHAVSASRWFCTLLLGALIGLAPGCGGGGGSSPAPTTPAVTAPVITLQPVAALAVTEGGSATLSVAATGSGTLTYQWKKNSLDLAGKTLATLALDPVVPGDAGSYTVLVTNTLNGASASTLSSATTLTVNPAATLPVITTQPVAQTAFLGGSAAFSVAATANGTLSYQWTKDGASLSGATSATLSLANLLYADAGTYACQVTNTLNGTTASITSSGAALVVAAPLATHFSVTGLPATVTAGASQAFTVTALDAANNPVPGYAGTVHFTCTDTAASLPADYTFTAGDGGTHGFTVTLKTAGPQSLTVTDAAAAAVTGSQALAVAPGAATQLRLAGYPTPTVPGASHPFTLTVLDAYQNLATGYAGTVHFTSSDPAALLPADHTFSAADAGVRSFSATLNTLGLQSLGAVDTVNGALAGSQTGITVAAPPTIQTQPAGATVVAPSGASFTVGATGTGTLTYQWRKNGLTLAGQTAASLAIAATDLQETSAAYSVVVTDGTGASVTSENATLTVMAPEPTFAGDPTTVPLRPLTVLPSYHQAPAFPHGAFRVGYDEALKNPVWTAYGNFKFTAAFLNPDRSFLSDDRLAAPLVTDEDFIPSDWTRGHQVMMSDLSYRYGSLAGLDTCRMSNIAPQDLDHNNNFWNRLEQTVGGSFTGVGGAWVPGLADTFGRIWIYTGPTFEADAPLMEGAVAPVRVPSGFWKIVVQEAIPGQPKVLALLTPNRPGLATTDAEFQRYTTSVARIEALTGLDLFPAPTSPLPPTFKTAVDVRGWGSHFEATGRPNVHMVAPSWDITTPAGTTLTFQGDATSPNSTIATTAWSFGDGQTASGLTATHTYNTGGTFTVSFTATDGLGVSSTLTRVITVTGGNAAPTVTGLPTSATTAVDTPLDVPFAVTDDAVPLVVTFSASSSNQAVVPDAGLTFAGTLASPILHVVPAAGASGTVTVTVVVRDGDLAATTKTFTLSVGVPPPPPPLYENFTWAGIGAYSTGDFTLSTGSWHFVTTLSVSTDPSDAKNDGQSIRMKALAGSAIGMNFDFGDATTTVTTVSVAYGVYLTDATNGKTATFSLYASQDQGASWTKVGDSVTASSNTLATATFSGLSFTGPVRFRMAVDGTPLARLNLDDFRIQ